MVLFTSVNGLMVKDLVEANKSGLMDQSMKVTGGTIRLTGEDDLFILMEMLMFCFYF